ncbi:hypothetical protein NL676_020003 [Syzygium grande]|nr:hypothetical protein NL676_020003 [Syzygium grande]
MSRRLPHYFCGWPRRCVLKAVLGPAMERRPRQRCHLRGGCVEARRRVKGSQIKARPSSGREEAGLSLGQRRRLVRWRPSSLNLGRPRRRRCAPQEAGTFGSGSGLSLGFCLSRARILAGPHFRVSVGGWV